MNPQPIRIEKSITGLEIGVFNHTNGLIYATIKNLNITSENAKQLLSFQHYKIINGEIHIRLHNYDFPLIKRKIIPMFKS